MLTVRAKGIHGDESVFQARHVIANRASKNSENVNRVECYDEKYEPIVVGGLTALTFGTVYVMNDNGKTVAVYYLDQGPTEASKGS